MTTRSQEKIKQIEMWQGKDITVALCSSWGFFGWNAGWSEAWRTEEIHGTKDFCEKCIQDKGSRAFHCTHLLGVGPDELLEKAKRKTARKTSYLKQQMSKENQLFHWVRKRWLRGTLPKWTLNSQNRIPLQYKSLEWKRRYWIASNFHSREDKSDRLGSKKWDLVKLLETFCP